MLPNTCSLCQGPFGCAPTVKGWEVNVVVRPVFVAARSTILSLYLPAFRFGKCSLGLEYAFATPMSGIPTGPPGTLMSLAT